ncbi:RNA polymerase sigma factor [Paenibacillus sp. LHD-38]|uniref:RNA polymerase sigma factor n=1 Tax=Paenibacillus sp. LHD-38 TaxID=3072143 RepID=UPI00280F1052|nr:RNA polymerase sigma factor [Paenibacillus sp. LHD-38]MDQ8738180.1 RNA polymerase sigma factor [Paenibacillus sp. LHD-38]
MHDFEGIYHEYFRDIYLFVFSLSRNEMIAEEITQETFFKALKSIDSFKGHCKISVWLCQIAKNTYFSYVEKQKRFEPESVLEKASPDNVEAALLDKDDALSIHKALHLLNEPYKEVFTLRVFGELSFAQISQLFEKTESWARVTFYRAKQKIQDSLKEEQRHDEM